MVSRQFIFFFASWVCLPLKVLPRKGIEGNLWFAEAILWSACVGGAEILGSHCVRQPKADDCRTFFEEICVATRSPHDLTLSLAISRRFLQEPAAFESLAGAKFTVAMQTWVGVQHQPVLLKDLKDD